MINKIKKNITKTLLTCLLVILISTLAFATMPVKVSAQSGLTFPSGQILTVTSDDGQSVSFTAAQILAMPTASGLGGYTQDDEVGDFFYTGTYIGVPVMYLCNLVGGFGAASSMTEYGSDGYTTGLTYQEVYNATAGFAGSLYNPTTAAAQNPTQPMTLILAYEYNGANLPSSQGNFRIMAVGPEGLVSWGSYSGYEIVKLAITGSPVAIYKNFFGETIPPETFNTCNSAGTTQSIFTPTSNVYFTAATLINSKGALASTNYPVYIVPHQTNWLVGMQIPTPVATATVTASAGNVAPTLIYSNAAAGQYDVLVKTSGNNDGEYDSQDLVLTNDVFLNGPAFSVNYALAAPTVSPSVGTVDQGQSSSLTSTAVSSGVSPYSYQWLNEAPSSSSYTPINGATSSSYNFATTISTATGTWNFELQVTDSTGATVTSNVASVNVNSALTAPTVSASVGTVDQGQSSILSSTVNTGSSPYTYQWLSETPGGSSYTAIGGAVSSSYTFATSASTALGSWSFELHVTDGTGMSVTSSAVSVLVDSALAAPSVSVSVGTVDQGQTSSLNSVAVTTGTSPISYQWLSEAPTASSFSTINGANSASYNFVTSSTTITGTWSFKLQVSDNAGATVTSNIASVLVNSALAAPSISASVSSLDQGQTSSLTSGSVTTGTYPFSYQWLNEAPGATSFSPINGATLASYTFASSTSTVTGTWNFELQVTDSAGITATSSAASVTVNSGFAAPSISGSEGAVDVGQSSTLSVSAGVAGGTSPLSYQWYEAALGGAFVTVGTATGSATNYVFSTTASTIPGTYRFELQVTDDTGITVTSNVVAVTVNALPTVSIAPSSWVMDVGQSTTFKATASGGSSDYTSYQWYVNGLLAQSGSASSMPFTPTSAATYAITVTVTDSLGLTSVLSSAATATVNPALTAPTVSASASAVDQGQSSSLSSTKVTTGTSTYTYQWLSQSPGATSFLLISGANSASYNFVASSSSATGTWSFELQVKDSVGTTVTSASTSVLVNSALVAPSVSATIGTVDQSQSSSLTSAPATTGTSPYSYQWLSEAPGASSYTAIDTATSANYNFVTDASTAVGTWNFELQITDNVGTVATSNVASVVVNYALSAPTVSTSVSIVDQGQSSIVSSTAVTTGTPSYTYQWLNEAPSSSSYMAIDGATSSSYNFATTTSTATGTWSFELQVTDAVGTTVTSNAASVNVNSALTAPTVSASISIVDQGQISSLTSTSVGSGVSPYSYQWLGEVPGSSSYAAINGATLSSYNFATAISTATGVWNFELQVTDAAGVTATSNAASISVNSALTAPTISVSLSAVSQGASSSLTSVALSTGTSPYTYQWFNEAPGATSFSPIGGATSASYDFAPSTSTAVGTWNFELQITDNAGTTVTSSAVPVTVTTSFVLPEYAYGPLVALGVCLLSFIGYRAVKKNISSIPHFSNHAHE